MGALGAQSAKVWQHMEVGRAQLSSDRCTQRVFELQIKSEHLDKEGKIRKKREKSGNRGRLAVVSELESGVHNKLVSLKSEHQISINW